VPLAFYFIRNKPEDVGLLPDNASNIETKKDIVHDYKEINWTLNEAIKTNIFWLIIFCTSIPPLINTALTFHLVSIMGENKLSPIIAALVLSTMAVIGFLFSFVAGFIIERVKTNIVIAFIFLCELIAIIILINASSKFIAILFGIVWGIAVGFERVTLSIIWPNFFGRKHLGSIKGVAMTTTVLSSALGPLPFAVGYDYFFGGYTEILIISMLLPFMGIITAFWARPPDKSI